MALLVPDAYIPAVVDLTAPTTSAALEERTTQWTGHRLVDSATVIDLTARTQESFDERPFVEGYHRNEDELRELELAIVGLVDRDRVPSHGIANVMIDGRSPLVDWSRTLDMSFGWYDMPVWMHRYEHKASMAVTIDFLHPEGAKIVQTGRLMAGSAATATSSGSQVVDGILDKISLGEILQHHQIPDLSGTFDAVTIYNTPSLSPSPAHPFGYSPYAYLGVIRYFFSTGQPVMLAYLNKLSAKSLVRNLIAAEPLGGRELRAPLIEGLEYNADFQAMWHDLLTFGDACFDVAHPQNALYRPMVDMVIPATFVKAS